MNGQMIIAIVLLLASVWFIIGKIIRVFKQNNKKHLHKKCANCPCDCSLKNRD